MGEVAANIVGLFLRYFGPEVCLSIDRLLRRTRVRSYRYSAERQRAQISFGYQGIFVPVITQTHLLAEINKQSVITKCFFTVCLFLSILADCFSQTTDVLQLHKQNNYKEGNIFLTSPKFEIVQMVAYNSNAIDGNYQMKLFLQVHKVDSLIENRTFNITTGTDVLSCFFDMQSTWNWEPEKADVEGAVTVLKRTKNKITLLFDLTVTDLRQNRIYVYKGERTFSKSKMARPKNWNDL